ILYKNCILQIQNYVLVGALPLTFSVINEFYLFMAAQGVF
ncbi:hypothetical protein FDUTEX481_05197, partial [Tolypothrix sp. PCC 7601]